MYELKDLSVRTRAASVAVIIWLATNLAYSVANFLNPGWEDQGSAVMPVLAVVNVLVLVLTIIFVSRWIYRASANAHARGGDLSISPGWSVGWYFIPVANLFKPFQAMKEIWFEAMGDGTHGQPSPPELIGWWALWVVTNIIDNVVFRMEMSEASDRSLPAVLGLASAMLAIPMTYLLLRIMKRIDAAQSSTALERVFA